MPTAVSADDTDTAREDVGEEEADDAIDATNVSFDSCDADRARVGRGHAIDATTVGGMSSAI
jgi:hypothetical protein